MSEYQNKAVALMTARLGTEAASDITARNRAFLAAAISLFHALGGSDEELAAAAQTAGDAVPAVDVAIGDVMRELAAIGTLSDLDIMQAAYNTLDRQAEEMNAPMRRPHKVG